MNELSDEARELLATLGDADGPTSAQTARMKRGLGLALGAAGGALLVGGGAGAAKAAGIGIAGAAAGAGAKFGGTGLGGLISVFALGAAAGVGVSASVLVAQRYVAPSAPAVASVVERAPAQPAARVAVNAHGVDAPVTTPLLAEVPPVAPLAPPALPAPPAALLPASPANTLAANTPVTPVEPTLGPEVELVIAAKRELTLGHAAQALALTDRLAAEFPSGALREERRLLRVLSLCALGQVETARREGREFAAAAPRSPLLPRLEQSCGGSAVHEPGKAR